MNEAWGIVAAAAIAAVPATIAAWNARKSRKQMKTRNGHTAGELLDSIRDDTALLKLWMIEHTRSHNQHVSDTDSRDLRDEARRSE